MVLSRSVGIASFAAATASRDISSYDESRAIEFAKLAGAAYCNTAAVESWSCGDFCNDVPVSSVKVCHGKTTRAYVGMWEGKGLVSFEGTTGLLAWLQNLDYKQTTTGWEQCGECKVHSGFLEEYNSLQSCIKTSLQEIGAPMGSSLRTTGHSLGAALNNLAMLDLDYSGWHIEESYDFGKPRTGDSDFADAWNSKFSKIAFRVTHHRDPVPQVPPDQVGSSYFAWEHVQPEIWYEGSVSSGYQECAVAHKTTCAEQYWNVPWNILYHSSVMDHLSYLDLDICGCPGAEVVNEVV